MLWPWCETPGSTRNIALRGAFNWNANLVLNAGTREVPGTINAVTIGGTVTVGGGTFDGVPQHIRQATPT